MLQRVFELERSVPGGLRPTYHGACFILGMGSGWAGKLFVSGILLTMMLLAGGMRGLELFFGLLAVAVVAGAAGGAIHGVLQPLESWGMIGTWLRWTVAIFGYVAACVLLTPQGPFTLQEPTLYPIAGGFSALGAAGLVLLDDRRPGRPSPRQFQLLRSRERLWAAARRVRARRLARPSGARPGD